MNKKINLFLIISTILLVEFIKEIYQQINIIVIKVSLLLTILHMLKIIQVEEDIHYLI